MENRIIGWNTNVRKKFTENVCHLKMGALTFSNISKVEMKAGGQLSVNNELKLYLIQNYALSTVKFCPV